MASKKDNEDTGAAAVAATNLDVDHIEAQRKKVIAATGGDTDALTIQPGERAAKLKYDIDGGLGSHKEGAVIRRLSESAFITLTQAGGHDVVEPGTKVDGDAVDASAPIGG